MPGQVLIPCKFQPIIHPKLLYIDIRNICVLLPDNLYLEIFQEFYQILKEPTSIFEWSGKEVELNEIMDRWSSSCRN